MQSQGRLSSFLNFPVGGEKVNMETGGAKSQRILYQAAKRLFDMVFSLLALIILSPLLLIGALWVILDSKGPAFYKQTRVGKDGVEFDVLKLRTMVSDAESKTGPVWAQVQDNRITRAGRILRKLYLDEIPQLINILKGDMSFVGPRPERAFFYPKCEAAMPGFSKRCQVRPGLTGLAQVHQGHHASFRAMRRKYRYDMLYIRQQSFLLDMLIILRTSSVLVREFKEMK